MRCHTQQYCNGRNYTQNFVMVIITLKTILNEKIGYNFCQVILSFWLREKVVPYKNYEIQKYLWIFLSQALATPRKKTNDPHRGRDPRLKPTVLKYLRTLSKQGCGACVCKIIPQKSPAAKCFWKWLINVGEEFFLRRAEGFGLPPVSETIAEEVLVHLYEDPESVISQTIFYE